ncbi:NADH:flavin oxidoreductase/NADH oxidase [Hyphomonas sp.]|uniref:NADH:flavin oxidoreductase/NADH oxidase n=1 Tax=Hyphomonas sp. TaxID=87 RepID=UPI0032EBDE37
MVALFTPLEIKDLTLRNRIVISPMHQYSADRGFATDWHLMNVGRYAAGGAGLVFVESTKVLRNGCGTVGDLGIWDDAFIPGLTRLASFIRSCGAAAAIQLGHSGRKARRARPWEGNAPLKGNEPEVFDWDDWTLIAPSEIAADERTDPPLALTQSQIADLVEAWVNAAKRALTCGFDVLELHAAHGYLIHQFLCRTTNQRTDAYGGSLQNRMRLLLEITEAVRSVWPSRKPLFVRLSCEDWSGWSLDDSIALAKQLRTLDVDVIDCSAGGIIMPPPDIAQTFKEPGYQVPFAEKIRTDSGLRTMAVGNIIHGDQANQILLRGQADLVAIARQALLNPNWPLAAALSLGLEPEACHIPDPSGFWLSKNIARQLAGSGPAVWRSDTSESVAS